MKSSILILSFLLSLSSLSAHAQDDSHVDDDDPHAGHLMSQAESKAHKGHIQPEQGQPSGTAGGHEGHQRAPVTRGPWSYHDRDNPKPYSKGRWEMVPGEGNTATFIAADTLSKQERCRALLNNPAVAVDRATQAACGAGLVKKGQEKSHH